MGIRRTFGWRSVLGLVLVLVLVLLGLAGTRLLTQYGRGEIQKDFLRAARSIAAAMDPEEVAELRGDPADIGAEAYRSVRQSLVRIREANPDARFVYLMAARDGKVIFLADAEANDSPDHSAPGDVYEEASADLVKSFQAGYSFVEGPLKDRWGEWVSGFAPIHDPETGAILAVLGIDWDVEFWHKQTSVYRWFGLALTLIPAVLAIALFLGLFHADQINHLLTEEMNERRRIEKELEHLSKHDPLTGLANRRTFDMLLGHEWRRALRAQLPLSVIMMDIDGFKVYNDHFGHQAGDEVLKKVSNAIREAVKRAGDEPARYGGEEFVVILPGARAEGALHVAESLRAAVESLSIPHAWQTPKPVITVSVGVATVIPDLHGKDTALLLAADRAMYRAKEGGRNRVEYLDS